MVANLDNNLGINKDDVLIVLNDVDKENWGIHGGYPECEVDIGFDTNV